MGKKRVIYPVLFLVLISVVVLIGWGLREYLRNCSDFEIKEIEISSIGPEFKHLDQEQIMKACGLAESEFNNIFDISLSLIKARLETNPWVEKAVLRRVLPDRLSVKIKEREGKARVRIKGRFFLLDSNSVVLPDIQNVPTYDYPLIEVRDIPSREPRMGQKLDSIGLSGSLFLLDRLKGKGFLDKYPVLSFTPHGQQGIFFILAQTKVEVRLPNKESEAVLGVLEQLLIKLEPEIKKIRYIDLRFQEPVIGKR